MSLTSKLTAALVLALLLACSHWYAYKSGNRNGVNAELVKSQGSEINRKDLEISALAQANIENEAKALGFAAAAKEASKDHEKELSDVRVTAQRNAGQRVQFDRSLLCGVEASGTKGSEAGSDGQGTAPAAFFPEWFAEDLRQAAAYADEITANMRYLVRRANEAGCFR